MKSCTTCVHYRKPKSFVWKDDWTMLLIPVVGWISALIIWLEPKTPWCTVGQMLDGEFDGSGPSCRKMRCFGSCGTEGKLHSPM